MNVLDNMIDGDALLSLTERALEVLIPVIGHRMKFLKLVNELKQKNDSGNRAEEVSDHQMNDCDSGESQSCSASSTENAEIMQENLQTRLVHKI